MPLYLCLSSSPWPLVSILSPSFSVFLPLNNCLAHWLSVHSFISRLPIFTDYCSANQVSSCLRASQQLIAPSVLLLLCGLQLICKVYLNPFYFFMFMLLLIYTLWCYYRVTRSRKSYNFFKNKIVWQDIKNVYRLSFKTRLYKLCTERIFLGGGGEENITAQETFQCTILKWKNFPY